MIDLVVRDALIVDGTRRAAVPRRRRGRGRPDRRRRRLDGERAERVIDAGGRVVCPGFVDPHSHSDFTMLTNPTAQSTIRQGVTTEVVGNCGWTYAPVSEDSRPFVEARMRTFAYDGPVEWARFGEHLSFLSDAGHSQNLAWFVGHNTVRYAAGVFDAGRDRGGAASRWSATSPRRWTRARSGSRPGSSSTPGARRRPTSSSA